MADKVGKPLWVWSHTATKRGATFQHPADIPVDDEALAKACFSDNMRGPRVARICPAKILQDKGDVFTIAVGDEPPRDVDKDLLLPWYEGLLLLEEIEAAAPGKVAWINAELKAILEQERTKVKGKLRSFPYVEKMLMKQAITGRRFVDNEGRVCKYRRQPLRGDLEISLEDGEEGDNFFKIREVSGYLPPWEAFCHEKCGFWQEFYQVRWESPCANVDYSKVENCIDGEVGTTWEPDECLPAHLDPLRIAAKRAWLKARKEEAESLQQQRQLASKRARVQEEERKPVRVARARRDGEPLQRDMLKAALGHDFAPPRPESLRELCSGWPMCAEEYPPGFGVADPPGFCFRGCDCMDDMRMQQPWETQKKWIEKPERTQAALSAINDLSRQTHFLMRRGTVSNHCYFETAGNKQGNATHAKAALELASAIEKAIAIVMKAVPFQSLGTKGEPVRIPAAVTLSGPNLDYEPLRFTSQVPLPPWLHLHPDNGQLTLKADAPIFISEPLVLMVALNHLEGSVGAAAVTITPEKTEGLSTPWARNTMPIAELFSVCVETMESSARIIMMGHFGNVFDLSRRVPREVGLGEWLNVTSRLLRMLRSSSTSNISTTAANRKGVAPRT